MSGQNRLVTSENAMENGTEKALASCLTDSNKEANRLTAGKLKVKRGNVKRKQEKK